MSIIYGTVQKFEAKEVMDQMLHSLLRYKHDTKYRQINGEVGIGLLHLSQTPECKLYTYCPENDLVIFAQGRLDYRENLCSSLEISTQYSDAEIIIRAYKKWGKESVHYLEGDWSFAVYDLNKKELFLARDKHGYTSLFYTLNEDSISFSSHPQALLQAKNFRREIHQKAFVSRLLRLKTLEVNEFLIQGIHTLHPAHTLTWKQGQIEVERYWHPESIEEDHDITIQEAGEELLFLLKQAVKNRLRTHKPICSTLSGGLDSGTVASLAAAELRTWGQPLATFSHVPYFKENIYHKTKIYDESPYILATANHSGNIVPHLIDSALVSPLKGLKYNIQHLLQVTHATSNAYWTNEIPTRASSAGYGTILTGEMGNGGISFPGIYYQPPYSGLSFKRKILAYSKKQMLKYTPQLWSTLRYQSAMTANYLHPELLKEFQEIINGQIPSNNSYCESAQQGKLKLLEIGKNSRCTLGGLKGISYGLNYRDPTADVRVLEFCLKLPNSLYFDSKHHPKQVIRQAMKGILPDQVLFSSRKGVQSSDLYHRLLHWEEETNILIKELYSSPLASQWMNLPQIEKDWKFIKQKNNKGVLPTAQFFKGLSFAYFLLLYEKGEVF